MNYYCDRCESQPRYWYTRDYIAYCDKCHCKLRTKCRCGNEMLAFISSCVCYSCTTPYPVCGMCEKKLENFVSRVASHKRYTIVNDSKSKLEVLSLSRDVYPKGSFKYTYYTRLARALLDKYIELATRPDHPATERMINRHKGSL